MYSLCPPPVVALLIFICVCAFVCWVERVFLCVVGVLLRFGVKLLEAVTIGFVGIHDDHKSLLVDGVDAVFYLCNLLAAHHQEYHFTLFVGVHTAGVYPSAATSHLVEDEVFDFVLVVGDDEE